MCLLEKYFYIQSPQAFDPHHLNLTSSTSLPIRKFVCDLLHKKLNYYFATDHSTFAEQVIANALLPVYEKMLDDDLAHYRRLNSTELFSTEYIEMKYICTLKLIELSGCTRREETLLKIVYLLNKIILIDEVSIKLCLLFVINSSESFPFLQTFSLESLTHTSNSSSTSSSAAAPTTVSSTTPSTSSFVLSP